MSDYCDDDSTQWQDICFSPDEMDSLRRLVYERLGISISKEKEYLITSKFGHFMHQDGIATVAELLELLRHATPETDLKLARFLTTNHTFFFREAQHLDILASLLKKNPGKHFRIWCAANSTGEEPYSILISLLENGIGDFEILGSDINLEVLKVCRKGEYRTDRFREMPKHLLLKYFTRVGPPENQTWKIKPELAKRVILKRLNLLHNFHFAEDFDIIFCRNVLIYFDIATQIQVISNLLRNLRVNGYLFVGHSEPLINSQEKIVQVAAAVYRKTG